MSEIADRQARAEIAELRRSVAALGDDMRAGFKELTAAVQELRASAGPSIRDMVDVGTKVVGLFAAVVAGILYLAAGSSSAELRELDRRISRIETALSMAAMRRPSPSAWVPRAGH